MNYTRFWLIFLLFPVTLYAQRLPGHRDTTFVLTADTILLDSLLILEHSVKLMANGQLQTAGINYLLDGGSSKLINKNIPSGTLVRIEYDVVALDIRKPVRLKDPALINRDFKEVKNPFLYSPSLSNEPLFNKEGLVMTGNISRGVTLGNNQNVVVNSNLNLQFSGKLSDLDVLAAISDENNPIQPEGNTQQLQDFDKVFIQFSKNDAKLIVGDFEMTRPDGSYFLNYYKKSRGLSYTAPLQVGRNTRLIASGDGAISRGRFVRNIINGLEGNQGPYQLRGPNGEIYLIVISGTESIYLDGQKMTRGEQNDYTIDYNSGEITFMPKRVINRYSRIVVEFQYADRNYARSVFRQSLAVEMKNLSLRFNYFTEQDNKNQPFLQDLTDSNKLQLALAGDDITKTYVSSIKQSSFSTNKILYRRIDTLGYPGVLVYAPDTQLDTVFYEAAFSYTGMNKGNYIQILSGTNGKAFQWIQPAGGIPQGDYEPVGQLVTPRRNQLLSAGADWKITPATALSVEYAHSIYDQNLYSDLDKQNDGGNGIRMKLVNNTPLDDRKSPWTLQTKVAYEQVDKQFKYVERYRDVEFDRTWNRLLNNRSSQDSAKAEQIVNGEVALGNDQIGSVFYRIGAYNRPGSLTGLQHQGGVEFRTSHDQINGLAELINTSSTTASSTENQVNNYKLEYRRRINSTVAGAGIESEKSRFVTSGDTLLSGSYGFDLYKLFLTNVDSLQLKYRLEYIYREDRLPVLKDLSPSTRGQNISGTLDYTQANSNRVSVNMNYRELSILNNTLVGATPEKTVLSRIEYDYGILKRVILGNTYWQLGSGNELRRDFQFVEVPPGQGIYIWKDFNDDGQQSTNEFVLASFADKALANYIKVFLATNTFIRTHANQFSQTLNLVPASVWAGKNGARGLISKFSNQTAYRVDRKTNNLPGVDFLNPFYFPTEAQVISRSSLLRNTFFFNRSNPAYGGDYTFTQNLNKAYLTYGFDTRKKIEHGINLRWNINSFIGMNLSIGTGDRSYFSDFYTENNYLYHFNEVKPKLNYQPTRDLRLTILYGYFEGTTSALYGNIRGLNQESGAEMRYNLIKTGVINLKISQYNIRFNGNTSSPLGYDMLQGLIPGINYLWGAGFQQQVGGNIQFTVAYDGRKSEGQSTLHTGKVEARYLF